MLSKRCARPRVLLSPLVALALLATFSASPGALAHGPDGGRRGAPSGAPGVAPGGASGVASAGAPGAAAGGGLGAGVAAAEAEPLPAPLTVQNPDAVQAALAGMRWREIGPANMGGRVTAIHGVPGDHKTFWFGGADGGVWKTTDGGTTFVGQWQDEEAYSVGAIAVAPSDPNVVWLGSGEGDPRNSVSYGLGVWRSTDGGTTWTHLGLDDTERIKRIVVDPRDPDVALVCAMGHEWGPNEERGVFKTTNAGLSWRKVLYVNEDTGCSDIDIDLSNPRNVYAGMWTFRRRPWRFDDGGRDTALWVSRDLGETWKKIETTPDEPMARIGLSVAQSSPNIVYLITEYPTAGTLFRSSDYGETWTMVNDSRDLNFRPFYYSDVYVDPSDADTLYTLSGGLSKSTDGGRTFERIAFGVHGDHQSFWIDPEDGDHLLSGSDGGYQVSYDGGETFHIFRNVALSQFYQIFFDDRDPYYVCGGLQDNGNWCGPSQVNDPSGILPDYWYTVSGGDGFYTVPVPGKPHLVYSNAQGGYFRVTDTRSGQTRSIEPYPRMIGSQGQGMYRARYRFNWDAPIHISPHNPDVVYWGGNVLFRSTDQGYSWDVISPDLTTDDPEKQRDSGGEIYLDNTAAEFHTTILTIAESPLEPGVVWVGTDDGNVQITRDGGQTWTLVNANIPGFPDAAWVGKIDASHHEAGTAYIAVDQHRMDDFTPHAYRCTNYGASCEDLSAGLPDDDYVKVVREDPRNPNLLYAGMERGILASWDAGDTWVDIRFNLPRVSVRDIKVHPRDNDLIIGTHGRGAFILDDIAPLQGLAEAMSLGTHLFDIRRATMWERWGRDSSLGSSTYRGENPEDGATINYFVARAPARPPTIRITDAAGNLVREFQHRGARAGVNRAIWDLSHDGPRPLASGGGRGGRGGFFGGGPSGPPAIPGTYTATLTVEGRTLTKDFELRGDPNVDTTLTDYEALLSAALKAREVESRINEMIDTVVDLETQLDNLLASIDGKNLANAEQIREQAGTAKNQIDELENKLRRPPPRMGYRQYPRLSEEISRLNRGITSAQARPTEGQLLALTELEQEAAERAAELSELINTTISELNRLLDDYPKIIVTPPGGGSPP